MVPDLADYRKPEPRHFVKTDLGFEQEARFGDEDEVPFPFQASRLVA
jgi:hypothetical protein